MACIICKGKSTKPETTDIFFDLAESYSDHALYEKTVQICTNCKLIYDNLPAEFKK